MNALVKIRFHCHESSVATKRIPRVEVFTVTSLFISRCNIKMTIGVDDNETTNPTILSNFI